MAVYQARKKEKLYREEINSKGKSKTQPAKKRAKCGRNERSWRYGGWEFSTMQPIASLGAVLGGLEVLGFDFIVYFFAVKLLLSSAVKLLTLG